MQYIYEGPDWPQFHWDANGIADALGRVRHRQGRLIGRMGALGFSLQKEAVLRTLTEDVLKSSEIEGEVLDRAQVRSSIARRLGMDAGGLAPVGSHPAGASGSGVHDLAGNASEWVADWFAEGFARGSGRNPKGPPGGSDRVIRGGGWPDAGERLASARRWHAAPDTRAPDIGFRCARDVR